MRLTSVNNAQVATNYNNNRTNDRNNIRFRGLTQGLVKFWQVIDTHGRGAQFTVEDMCGTNLPRTYKGAMAGYKYTGKVNIPALMQEAIREFLTGPTMCLSPLLVLHLATKASGQTNNTHLENITNLSYLMEKIADKSGLTPEDYQKQFYQTVVNDMLTKTVGEASASNIKKEQIEELTEEIIKYHSLSQEVNGEKTKQAKKAAKNAVKNKFEDLQNLYQKIIKSTKDNFTDTDFLSVKYSFVDGKQGGTKFKNYIDYLTAYAEDYANKNTTEGIVNTSTQAIQAFKKSWLGKRSVVAVRMWIVTAILMATIPKIYTLASGKINPNASNIYDEANKNNKMNKGEKVNNEHK